MICNTANPVRTIFTLFAHLTCIGFLVVAGLSIPEAWALNRGEYTQRGSTLFIPVNICDPDQIALNGSNITFSPGDDVGKCHTLEYLLNACVASIFFAGGAIILFLVFGLLARNKVGPVSMSSVFGMSLFLTFSLLQCAVCYWALFKECQSREKYVIDQYKKLGSTDIAHIKTYGDKMWFYIGMILALASAGLLFIDTVLSICCPPSKKPKQPRKEPSVPVAAPEQAPIAVADPESGSVANETQRNDSVTGSPAWASTDY
jgi:hypothetical protein